MTVNEKDNIWLKFLDYKRMRDDEILLTVEALTEIIERDEDFSKIVLLNPEHEHYKSMKEIVGALQIYHQNTIDMVSAIRDTLSASVNLVK